MESIWILIVNDIDGGNPITWRATEKEAEAFADIYNMNRASDLVDVVEVRFL